MPDYKLNTLCNEDELTTDANIINKANTICIIKAKDIELVMIETGVNKAKAIELIRKNDGDICGAIMANPKSSKEAMDISMTVVNEGIYFLFLFHF